MRIVLLTATWMKLLMSAVRIIILGTAMDHLLDVAPQQQQPKLWQEKNEEGSSRREGGIESIIVYQSYVDLFQLHLKNKVLPN